MNTILQNKIKHGNLTSEDAAVYDKWMYEREQKQQQRKAVRIAQKQGMHKMKGKIFYYCYEMGWTIFNEKKGRPVVDFKRLENWMLNFSYLKKKLDRYTYKELPKLVSQFESVYKSFLNKI